MMKHTEKAEKISITLPPEMLAAIKNRVASGVYGSTSEVIREAMRLLQRKDEEYQSRLALIRSRLEQSANSGNPISLDKAFAHIEHLHQQHTQMSDNESI